MTWLIDIHILNKNNSWLRFFDGKGSGKKEEIVKKEERGKKEREKKKKERGKKRKRKKKRGKNLFLEFDFKSD